MAYGILKCDQITFTNGGIDQTVTVSGIVQSISGNITATGTIQAATIIGTSTVSGATVTGDSGQYGNLNSISGVFTTQLSGATITGDIGQYATLTGISGVFTTAISGATITGDAGNYSELTAISGVFTTQVSGATVTGDAGSFTTVTGGVATITSGVFALGTNSLPSISFSSDPDTGIYSPGADQVALSTNGTGRLFVDASGNVGIGTTPSYALDVNGLINTRNSNSSAFDAIQFYGTGMGADNKFWRTQITTTDQNWQTVDDAYTAANTWLKAARNGNQVETISFYTGTSGTSERLRITSAGLVGIGTSSPVSRLDLSGGADGTLGAITFAQGNATNKVAQVIGTSSGTNEKGIAINTYHYANVNAVRITSDGKVGVGTTAPTAHITLADSGNYPFLHWNNSSNTTIAFLGWHGGTGGGDDFRLGTVSTKAVAFQTNNTERARIDSSGRLLLGTSTAPSGINTTLVLSGNNSSATANPVILFARNNFPNPGLNADLGLLGFGNANYAGAQITGHGDGTWTSGTSHPTRLVFSVTADGASSPTEALRISSNRAITVSDGGNVVLGTTTGTKIGTATTQKLGFYNATPVVQPAAVADATDAASVITQLNDLLSKLRTLGIIAT